MNGAFLHLAVNHVPVIGVPFAFFILAFGWARNNRDLTQLGLFVLILMGALAYLVEESGEMAAKIVRDLPGVTPGMIHEHALAAEWGFRNSIAVGVIALIGFWKSAKSRQISKLWTGLALFGALFLSTVMGRVAHLGGLIRHQEVALGYTATVITGPAQR